MMGDRPIDNQVTFTDNESKYAHAECGTVVELVEQTHMVALLESGFAAHVRVTPAMSAEIKIGDRIAIGVIRVVPSGR